MEAECRGKASLAEDLNRLVRKAADHPAPPVPAILTSNNLRTSANLGPRRLLLSILCSSAQRKKERSAEEKGSNYIFVQLQLMKTCRLGELATTAKDKAL
eukprot:g16999.t1